MKVRFLYFSGCPNAEPTLNLLRQVLQEKGINAEVEIIEITSEDEAKQYKFLGSPTIQINGLDIEKERQKDLPVFGCRIYQSKEGNTGVPPKEIIIKAIEEEVEFEEHISVGPGERGASRQG